MFGQTISQTWTFETTALTEAFHRLMFVAESGQDIAVLAGESGSGRSCLLKSAEKELQRLGFRTICIGMAALNQTGLLWHLCGALSIAPNSDSESMMLASVRDEILGRTHIGQRTVVLLDDIDRTSEDVHPVLAFLRGLNHETQGMVVTIVSTTQLPPALNQEAGFRISVPALTETQSRKFVTEKLRDAKVSPSKIAGDGCQAIVDLAAGNLTLLHRFCDLACIAVNTDDRQQSLNATDVHNLVNQVAPSVEGHQNRTAVMS